MIFMKWKFLGLFLLTLSLFSCREGSYYHHFERLPLSGWSMYETLHFVDSLSADAPEVLKLELNLRHNATFPYQNLWLYIKTTTSDDRIRRDTVNWTLAEPSGHWLGSGWGSLYNDKYILPDIEIKDTGARRWFKIEINHGMRDKTLTGIEDIGICVRSE